MINPLSLAVDLMRCPSVTPEDCGALDVLQKALASLGFACTRLPFSEPGEKTVDNLYARLGSGKPFFCFAGHTDVVPPGDESRWDSPPFQPEVRDGYLYGRGAEDMKAAIACFAAAVSRIQDSGFRIQGSIGFIITGDEEGYAVNGTKKMVAWMKERGEIPDASIVGEPTNPERIGDMAKIGRRGSMNMVLTVKGKQGHVAYPHLADNPVTPLVHILHELKAAKLDEGTEFFQASNLEITSIDVGNPVKNVIPGQATARVNIRFNNLHTAESLAQWTRAIAAKHTKDFTLEMHSRGGAFLTEPGAFSALVSGAIEAASGRAPELSTVGGASDAIFIKELCPVIEFGTTGKTAHMVNERVRVDDLELLTRCYEEILRRFLA